MGKKNQLRVWVFTISVFFMLLNHCGSDSMMSSEESEINIDQPLSGNQCLDSIIKVYQGPAPNKCSPSQRHVEINCQIDKSTCSKVCQTDCVTDCDQEKASIVEVEPKDCKEGDTHRLLDCHFDQVQCQNVCDSQCVFENTPKTYHLDIVDSDFSVKTFNQVLSDAIFGRVKGYAFSISNSQGELVGWGYGGVAREPNAEEGFQPFTHETIQPVGSISKMFMAATLLNAIEKNVEVSLLDPMEIFLANRWTIFLHPDFQPVTLAMLLQHKTGLNKNGSILNGDGPNISVRLALGAETEKGSGYRYYSNATGLLGQLIISKIIDPDGMAFEEAKLADVPIWDIDTYDIEISFAGAYQYFDYLKEYILFPAQVSGSCHHASYWHENFALLYSSPSSQYGQKLLGVDGLGNQIPFCAQGGFATSALGLQRFLSALKYSEKIISHDMYALMENIEQYSEEDDESGGEIDALGYARFIQVKDGVAFCHGGDVSGAHANICSFPNGYQAAILVNSNGTEEYPISSFILRQQLGAAYDQAINVD